MIKNGRYQLHETLGEGGMGIVYRATDRLTGTIVGLKQVTLPPTPPFSNSLAAETTKDDLRLALAHEFQILAGLRHPHIISVLDYGFDEEKRPFFTMTYLPESQTILEFGQNQSFDAKITLIQQLLQALAYLHRHGVLHRDLKPGNVLVSEGSVRVLDFGLSAHEQDSRVSTGGTILYMAPELFDDVPYSRAADLHAVGILLYQLLTGNHPFAPIDHAFIDRVMFGEPNYDALDERLRPFFAQLLTKQPEQRFANANVALQALAQALGQPVPAETKAIRESFLQAAKFVGREHEIAQLETALQQAITGRGTAWLIGGESGVGKTRLINELRTQALVNGFQVLRGQGVSGSGGVPYQLWREPLRQLVVTLPQIDDLTASVLLPLVPDIGQLLGREVPSAPELEGMAAQQRLFTTIARLFKRVERPLLLILEDLHWANVSLLPLPYLLRHINRHRLLVVGSYRSDERPDLPERLRQMSLLPLARLTPAALSELSSAMLGPVGEQEAVLTLLQRETEGNAFFAVEVVRALAEQVGRLSDIGQMALPEKLVPNGIQDIVQRRLSKLPDSAKALLVQTAVAGRELDIPLTHTLAEALDVENWWLPLCADAAVLEVQNGVWQFSHGKIQDGLLANLPPSTLIMQHRVVAQAIERCYPEDKNQAARLTFHWSQAGDQEKVQGYAFLAGQMATSQFANEEATAYFSHALAATPADDLVYRYKILMALEKIYDLTGQREEGAAALAQLTTIADTLDDPEKQVEVLLREVHYASDVSQFALADDRAKTAVSLAQAHQLLPQIAMASVMQAHVLLVQGNPDEAEDCLQQAETLNQSIQDPNLELSILNIYRNLSDFRADYQAAQIAAEKRLALSRKMGNKLQEGGALMTLGLVFDKRHAYVQAQRCFEESLALRLETGDRSGEGLCLLNMGNLYIRYGAYDEAWQTLQKCLQISQEVNDRMNVGIALYNLGWIATYWADYDKALTYTEASYAISQQIADREGDAYALTQLGRIARRQQRYEAAHTYYLEALKLRQEMNQAHFFTENQIGIALAAVAAGENPQPFLDTALENVHQDPQITGIDAPFEIYFDLIDCLHQVNHPQLRPILVQAHSLLQTQANRFEDETIRRSFLQNVPTNRQIVTWFEALNEG
jgi:predicted ATPase